MSDRCQHPAIVIFVSGRAHRYRLITPRGNKSGDLELFLRKRFGLPPAGHVTLYPAVLVLPLVRVPFGFFVYIPMGSNHGLLRLHMAIKFGVWRSALAVWSLKGFVVAESPTPYEFIETRFSRVIIVHFGF